MAILGANDYFVKFCDSNCSMAFQFPINYFELNGKTQYNFFKIINHLNMIN